MTDQELNDYLKSIGGLIYHHKERVIMVRNYFAFRSGWNLLIKELIEKLVASGWNKRLLQAKEKFGGLRWYVESATDEQYKLIHEAEAKSYHICEICGKEGKLRGGSRWIQTLCDEHVTDEQKEAEPPKIIIFNEKGNNQNN